MAKRTFISFVGLVLILVGLGPNTVFAAADVDFSGTWVLNREKSDLGAGRQGNRPGGRGGRRGGAGGALKVEQAGDVINVEQGRRGFVLKPGQGVQEINTPGGGTVEASWDGDVLVVVNVNETPRGKVTRMTRWTLSAADKVLTQELSMQTPAGTQTRTMVYEKQ